MAVMKMVALTMIGPDSEMEPVARQMVLTGGFQPLPLDLLVNDRSLRSRVTTETENPYDELLNKVSTVWKIAGEMIPEPSPVTLTREFTLAAARHKVEQTSKRLEIWEKRRLVMTEEEELLIATKLFVEELKGTEFGPEELADSKFLIPFFGRVSNENYQRLTESSEESPILVSDLIVVGGNTWALVLTVKGYEESTKKLLEAVYFKEFSLKAIAEQLRGSDPLGQVNKRIANHERAIKGLAKAAKDMLKEQRAEYELLYSQLYTMQRVYDVCKGRGEVSGMYVLSGWIPADTLAVIRKTIEEEAPMTTIMVEETKDITYSGIRVPTLLQNNPFFRAFQDIVSMYSLPSYGEIDPSPIVAISFILFFGFMFGDIGHGLMIYLASTLLVKKGMMRRSFGQVMKYAATSSIVFGALYGSIFGLEDIIPALWLSPMHDTNKLLLVAICMGVFMISLGLILNMITQYRAKDFGRLLFDGQGMAGLMLYWTMAALAAIYMTGTKIPEVAADIMWGGIGVLMLLMIFRDVLARYLLHQKEEGESVVLNIFEIMHNLMSFVSNTASFVRLAAFALNHVGLSLAVIMLSEMVHSLPGGIVMKGIILVIGNIVIVCLEGLIVFIQTLRLEYYEFFGKFYKGGGSAFKPVGWKKDGSKYVSAAEQK
ncbi:MAG TPA: V-type ATPase 116kDa subunit family protein [Synergistaceae bacterium]|jgi:V/A-type H+-transporting ATPase subunit I|nr:ATPase [Synergistaceae bacterium]NLL41420.1 ATPase [Synergistaceae bacterium]HPX03641.1 V-type ATPase 116kDa subunit family protein [Synergistaceae bacterium]HQA54498.1 V-type ATPase 116kDa subunit family protein [Synergistaceae bacterium]